MPSMISNHKKHVVETKLKRFYSTMNQAIQLSETQNGSRMDWNFEYADTKEDNFTKGYDEKVLTKFYETYLKNYLKVLKTDFYTYPYNGEHYMRLYFADGSISLMGWFGHDYIYCIDQKSTDNSIVGKNCFIFAFMPLGDKSKRGPYFLNKGLEPYINPYWDGTREGLKQNDANYTKLIQLNDWKIPKNYPLSF